MDTTPKRPRYLSGVQPSGKLHLGNYFGAIKQHIELQHEGECFFFIADYHALTTIADVQPEPKKRGQTVRERSHDVALDYLALGNFLVPHPRLHEQGTGRRAAAGAVR